MDCWKYWLAKLDKEQKGKEEFKSINQELCIFSFSRIFIQYFH
jgi:hypothetical protein